MSSVASSIRSILADISLNSSVGKFLIVVGVKCVGEFNFSLLSKFSFDGDNISDESTVEFLDVVLAVRRIGGGVIRLLSATIISLI